MSKQKKAVEKKVEVAKSGRTGYKRKSNGRVDQLGDSLKAKVNRAMNVLKTTKDNDAQFIAGRVVSGQDVAKALRSKAK
ncbi:hypothetical protein HPMBJEAJ_00344 [Aeromonas phage avDM6]|nr:hypothetical protein HPMBJEAJ_00344 [Aeromonas phage avDM6]